MERSTGRYVKGQAAEGFNHQWAGLWETLGVRGRLDCRNCGPGALRLGWGELDSWLYGYTDGLVR